MTDDVGTGLSTGISLLDDALGGGVPPGSLVALAAPPRAQSEPLLYAMAGQNRTRYLSTLRPAKEVTDAIRATVAADPQDVHIDVRGVDGEDILGNPEAAMEGLDANSLVVVDPTTELEQGDRERYRAFLDVAKRALRMTDSVGLFHCHENTPSVLRRDMTLARADLVWDVSVEIVEDDLRTRLAIPKFRGGTPLGLIDLSFDESGIAAEIRR
jgi:KaiC/GvpD/RAD55 family RecA-like ATPase